MKKKILLNNDKIWVFYACDDSYANYLCVSIQSLIAHASFTHTYEIVVLSENMSKQNKAKIRRLSDFHCRIHFTDPSAYMQEIEENLVLRDYYSKTTYYRFFIPELFPEVQKAVYIDGDTILLDDIAKLYDTDVTGFYLAAAVDRLVCEHEIFSAYSERTLGIPGGFYFNAGVLVINCNQFRRHKLSAKFMKLLMTYSFVVAQDQDYLNVLCRNRIKWLPAEWNCQMYGYISNPDEIRLVHYNLAQKPWNQIDCPMRDYFWKYAAQTECYEELVRELNVNLSKENVSPDNLSDGNSLENVSETEHTDAHVVTTDTQRMTTDVQRATASAYKTADLETLAYKEAYRRDNFRIAFLARDCMMESRIIVRERIRRLERKNLFDMDVEDDPVTYPLEADEIRYLNKTLMERLQRKTAFFAAAHYRNFLLKRKQFVIREIKGLEHFNRIETGAIITCNHFHPNDSLAVQEIFEQSGKTDRKLYRVIREGNYTNFPGFSGFLMRNCDTLPLSSKRDTMKLFMEAVGQVLEEGNFISVFPEQSMWWNYRKPRPLKRGAYLIAHRYRVPVLPVFITMENLMEPDRYGYPVQAYTIYIGEPIFPDLNVNKGVSVEQMMKRNEAFWKETYEKFYHKEMKYSS